MSARWHPANRPGFSSILSIPTGSAGKPRTRFQAEPGPLDSKIRHRWLRTPLDRPAGDIYNNKGKPVRQYEPFFSASPSSASTRWGVSSVLFYDPVERVVATLHPDNTFEKVVFDAWWQTSGTTSTTP